MKHLELPGLGDPLVCQVIGVGQPITGDGEHHHLAPSGLQSIFLRLLHLGCWALRPIHFKDETLSLCHPERELWISRRTEILRGAQDDTREAASFDSQNVLFEMNWALRLATVPVFGEQIEKYLLSWMLANDLLVQCDTESWPIRQREEAIHHFGIAGRSSLDPVFGKVV